MPWHTFIKLDIEEFFTSRRPHQLVDDCARLVDEGTKPLFKKAMYFILDSQYVESPYLQERLFKIIERSGMGLTHSGDVADGAFFNVSK